jgi:hypothetical protein
MSRENVELVDRNGRQVGVKSGPGQGGKGTEPVPTSRRKRRAARGARSVAEVQ